MCKTERGGQGGRERVCNRVCVSVRPQWRWDGFTVYCVSCMYREDVQHGDSGVPRPPLWRLQEWGVEETALGVSQHVRG